MILNRLRLKEYGLTDRRATSILKKAVEFKITYDKTLFENGRICSYIHFDSKDFIESQTKRAEKMRSDFKIYNMGFVKEIKDIENEFTKKNK